MSQIDDQFSFLEYRREQEKRHFERNSTVDPLSSILTVEINTTELCNRKCVFCPRHDPKVFPNRNLHMTPDGARILADRLKDIDYKGKVSLSGFGENLLNPYFIDIVNELAQKLPNAIIECNTNGDRLDYDYVVRLYKAGLNFLYINLYDGPEQYAKFDKIMNHFDPEQYKYRMHWSQADHGLILNNRSGTIDWIGVDEVDVATLKGKPCHYPFYKMFVDWNGDVLFCSNDWGREHVVGNLFQSSVYDVWFSPIMRKIRNKLMKGNRDHSPCDKCSVDGTLFGKQSFEIIKEYENSSYGIIETRQIDS